MICLLAAIWALASYLTLLMKKMVIDAQLRLPGTFNIIKINTVELNPCLTTQASDFTHQYLPLTLWQRTVIWFWALWNIWTSKTSISLAVDHNWDINSNTLKISALWLNRTLLLDDTLWATSMISVFFYALFAAFCWTTETHWIECASPVRETKYSLFFYDLAYFGMELLPHFFLFSLTLNVWPILRLA